MTDNSQTFPEARLNLDRVVQKVNEITVSCTFKYLRVGLRIFFNFAIECAPKCLLNTRVVIR